MSICRSVTESPLDFGLAWTIAKGSITTVQTASKCVACLMHTVVQLKIKTDRSFD